jgi:hypothetical protein
MKLGSTKPPFTMKPSRSAVLRCDGKFVVSGRASFVWETFLLRRAAGVPGNYEIRRNSRGHKDNPPWHALNFTMEEGELALLEWGSFGPRRVTRMRKVRENRRRQGLEVR